MDANTFTLLLGYCLGVFVGWYVFCRNKKMIDYLQLFILYLVLRIRWVYFHIHPHYQKFYVSEQEAHFINKYTGEIVSDVIMELTNGKKLRWWFN